MNGTQIPIINYAQILGRKTSEGGVVISFVALISFMFFLLWLKVPKVLWQHSLNFTSIFKVF